MRPLSVVQLLPALEAGGVERSTLEIAAALRARGHRSLVISAGGRLLPELQALGSERSEEHTSAVKSLMRTSSAGFCSQKPTNNKDTQHDEHNIPSYSHN